MEMLYSADVCGLDSCLKTLYQIWNLSTAQGYCSWTCEERRGELCNWNERKVSRLTVMY